MSDYDEGWLTEVLYQESSDGVLIIHKRQIIHSNPAGAAIMREYDISLDKLLDRCEAKGCELHSTMAHCQNCYVKESFDPKAFPIVLVKKTGEQENFSGSYQQIKKFPLYSLSLRNLTQQDKTQSLFQQKKLIAYVSRAQEQERKKLAQELHDGLAQSVFSTLLEVRQIKRSHAVESELLVNLKQVESQLVNTLDDIKRMALDLRPSALDDLGLPAAITSLINRLEETTGIEISFISQVKQQRFSESIEITFYRVLQEALMNAIKYAQVDHVNVLLVEKEEQLVLEVIDQGVGFQVESPTIKGTGMGLLHIQERVEMIEGNFVIESKENVGTHIKIGVPIH